MAGVAETHPPCHRGCDREPAITRGPVSVCSGCGGTSFQRAAHVPARAATYEDLCALAPGDVDALTQQRRRVVPHVKKSGRK